MRVLPYCLPLFVDRAEGPYVWDVDGHRFIDLNMGYGPQLLGHRAPIIMDAIAAELGRRGTAVGFPHALSHEAAELVKESVPSIELLRFTSTGTEAGQTAVRLARAFTGRSHLVLFEGHYHGSSSAVFHRYHATLEELEARSDWQALPGTNGTGDAVTDAYVIPWNDPKILERLLRERGDTIAAVIMEPVMGNGGVIPPSPGYLREARRLTHAAGALLIFDEVITGFRVAKGGAQELYDVSADITMLSKALSGGAPAGAVGGRRDVMALLGESKVFHGGVFSGNPMGMAAVRAAQLHYREHGSELYRDLEATSKRLADGLRHIFDDVGVPVVVQHVGAMLSCWFLNEGASGIPRDYREVRAWMNTDRHIRFQHAMQRSGVFYHPNLFEPWFPSAAHTASVIDETLAIFEKVARTFPW
jgi:glutamate-1-semialdehyde 2,1-aminomutase